MVTLLADSGSSKTDWAIVNNGRVIAKIRTQGINPITQTKDTIKDILLNNLLCKLSATEYKVRRIHYYGSGCTENKKDIIRDILIEIFPLLSDISVESDLLAAARALCQRKSGIACILGTGSNSCLYDGEKIIKNIPPLGYILGDEGSGANLGKILINAIYKEELPEQIINDFNKTYNLCLSKIIDKVYQKPMQNKFLAEFTYFIAKHLNIKSIEQLVINNFRTFFRINVSKYHRQDLEVSCVGSVAQIFYKQLLIAAKEENVRLGKVIKHPMDDLIHFHSNK